MRNTTKNTKGQRYRPPLVGNRDAEFHNSVTDIEVFHNKLNVNQLDYEEADEEDQIMFLVINEDGRIISVNKFCEEELGYEIKELMGKPVSKVIYNTHREQIFDYMLDFIRSPMQVGCNEFFMVRRDESIFLAKSYLFRMYDANGDKVLLLLSEKINERFGNELEKAIDNELGIHSSAPKSTYLVVLTKSGILLEGVRKILDSENDIEIIAAGSNDREVISLVKKYKADVLIIDTALSKLDIEEVMGSINESEAETEVILILHSLDEEIAINALQLGVKGFLTSNTKSERLIQAIRFVGRGEIWGDVKIMKKILARLLKTPNNNSLLSNHGLTKREIEITKLVSQGYSNKEIGKKLLVSESTIKTHLYNIYKKLDINNRTQLSVEFQK